MHSSIKNWKIKSSADEKHLEIMGDTLLWVFLYHKNARVRNDLNLRNFIFTLLNNSGLMKSGRKKRKKSEKSYFQCKPPLLNPLL